MAASYRHGRLDGVAHTGSIVLPDGNCNFRDLASGAKAPVCGCKRFWLNGSQVGSQGEREHCFCGHHACFHGWLSQQQRAAFGSTSSVPHLETAHRNTGRDTPEGYYAIRNAGAGASPKPPTGLGIAQPSRSQSQSINTRVWEALNGFARQQEDGTETDTSSKLPSTAVPSDNGDAVPQVQRSMGPPIEIPAAPTARTGLEDYMGSATEVATPSIRGTPDIGLFAPPGTQSHFSHARSQPAAMPASAAASQPAQPQPPATGPATSQQDLQAMLHSYGKRLDILESLSYSHVPVEEVHDKFEHYDVRLLDLEQWRGERDHEREHLPASPDPGQASSSKKRRRPLPNEVGSFSSDEASFDHAAAAQTEAAVLASLAVNAEVAPRIEKLERRVDELEQASLPSFARPWHVQVVLLPWGRDLRGIWFSSEEATQHSQRSMPASEEWVGAPSMKTSFHSTTSAAWTTESIEQWAQDAQDWLSPKACGPNGTVFKRLASRGLVQDISITAPDSHHIMDLVNKAFGRVLEGGTPDDSAAMRQYQGLREPFLPLRKVRKSTRLRFLSQSEMVTSSSWTAGFLDSSVFLKLNGQRRLYITTPSAYLQDQNDGLDWAAVRQLPARNADGELQAAQVHASIAIEACWSYSQKLDYQTSLHSSFGSNETRRSQWSMRSQHSPEPDAIVEDHPMSPLSEARPVRQRTVSLPSSASVQHIVPTTKRRVASFELQTNNHEPHQNLSASKRRRLSFSPEAERRGVNFTPRLSREPPSPFHSDSNALDSRSQGNTSSSRAVPRGTTPFAYATPHSNSHLVGLAELVGCSAGEGDTELGTDLAGEEHAEHNEEEWEGVGEGTSKETDEHMSDGDSAVEDAEIDDDDLEEGLTIYES